MKCPKCGNIKNSTSKVSGFSSGVEKECNLCGCVWIEKNNKLDVIYQGKQT